MERNLQEQVLYLTNELNKIKQSLGTALPDPIEGPEGPEGPEGQRGEQGEQGFGIVGFGTQFPSSGRDGDWFLLKKSTMSGIDFVMCRCVSQHWVEQFSIRGPAGPIANAMEIVANPTEPYSEELKKIKIEGVTYAIPNGNYVKWINAPQGDTLTDQERDWIINGVFVNGDFLGYKNPVLFPASKSGNYYYGVIAGPYEGTSYTIIGQYQINPDNSIVERGVYGNIELRCIKVLNGAAIPEYPSSPTNRKKIVYNTDNTLQWIDDKLFRHNIRLDFTGDIHVYFTLYSASGAPITDISEVLELKYQAIGSICVYSNNFDNTAAIIINFNSGDLGIDIGGGVTHLDYGNDLVSIVDDNSEVY